MLRFIVIVIAILAVVGIVLAAAGVLHFQSNANESTIIIDKQELNEKTHKAVEKTEEVGSKALEKTGDALHKAAEELRKSPDNKPAPTRKPADGNGSAPQTDQNMDSSTSRSRELQR